MSRRFASHLGSCFRDLGVAAAYALAAAVVVTLDAAMDDRALGLGWIVFDLVALPAGVVTLICCEALLSTVQERRVSPMR